MSRPSETSLPAKPLGISGLTLFLAWLIPGLGHAMHRDYKRAVMIFGMVQLTFLFGLLLHGAVLWPATNPQDWGFNIVNILTFVVQLGNGLGALLCLGATEMWTEWASQIRGDALFELGMAHLLVAGAANIFSIGGVYDLHLRHGRPEGAIL